jgi:glucose-6-phosphate-specific signal transduction histidine kinase
MDRDLFDASHRSTASRAHADAAAARGSPWRTDLWLVAAATLCCYVISSALELNEAIARSLARFEVWQADEVPLSITFLACGLAWYAWRRRRESQAQLALHERAEQRIADLLARNRELSQRLIAMQESDRLELARELHDELGQICTAIRIETACLRGCQADDREGILAAAERADRAALSLYQSVRAMLRRLRPANLDELGLEAALRELCEAWTERTAVACDFQVEGDTRTMGERIDITIYRVAQEALTNVARHAAARKAQVTLSFVTDVEASLTIEDDGCGMSVAEVTRGFGLLGATERAAAVGGRLELRSALRSGTTVDLRIPLPVLYQPLKADAGTAASALVETDT